MCREDWNTEAESKAWGKYPDGVQGEDSRAVGKVWRPDGVSGTLLELSEWKETHALLDSS